MKEQAHPEKRSPHPSDLSRWMTYQWLNIQSSLGDIPDHIQAKVEVQKQISHREYWDGANFRSLGELLDFLDKVLGYPNFITSNKYVVSHIISHFNPRKAQDQVRANHDILRDQQRRKATGDTTIYRYNQRLYDPWDPFDNNL